MLKGKQNVVDLGKDTYLCSLSFLFTRNKTFGKKNIGKNKKETTKNKKATKNDRKI